MSSILLLKDGAPTIKIGLGERCTIGRSSECDVQLLDGRLSRAHSRIVRREGDHWLEDLESRNGTFLMGARLREPVRLKPGDEFTLGDSRILFDPPVDVLHARSGDKTLYLVDEEMAPAMPLASPATSLDPEALLAIHDLTCEVVGLLELDRLLATLLDRLMAFFEADRGLVLLRSEPSGRLRPAVIRAPEEAVALSRSLVEHALSSGGPLLVPDAIRDVTFEGARSVIAHQLRSVMLVPLVDGEDVLGVLQLDSRERDAYDQESLARFALLARAATLAVRNARHYARARRGGGTEGSGEAVAGADTGTRFIGEDERVLALLRTTDRAAASDARVLITGESGTGKELIARRLHERGPRAAGPWVAINCAAVPESLLESELFGHEKGAFTGAGRRKRGCFELADEGTLFLDEIGELPLAMQVKLLRALQEGVFYRVGGERPVAVDVRVIAATNRRLPELVAADRFRQDLFYRLAVVTLELPPLRERRGDVMPLLLHFLAEHAVALSKPMPSLDPGAQELLEQYHWPGNVREVRNIAERLVVLNDDATILSVDLPVEIALGGGPMKGRAPGKLREALAETERELIAAALAEARGKKVLACRILGISRPTLDKKIVDYDLGG